jgi:hypothetical protein
VGSEWRKALRPDAAGSVREGRDVRRKAVVVQRPGASVELAQRWVARQAVVPWAALRRELGAELEDADANAESGAARELLPVQLVPRRRGSLS